MSPVSATERVVPESAIDLVLSVSKCPEDRSVLTGVFQNTLANQREQERDQTEFSITRYERILKISGVVLAVSIILELVKSFNNDVVQNSDQEANVGIASASFAAASLSLFFGAATWWRKNQLLDKKAAIEQLLQDDEQLPEKVRNLLRLLDRLQKMENQEISSSSASTGEETKQHLEDIEAPAPVIDEQRNWLVEHCLKAIHDIPEQIFGFSLPSKDTFLNAILSVSNWPEIFAISSHSLTEEKEKEEEEHKEAGDVEMGQSSMRFQDQGQSSGRNEELDFVEASSSTQLWEALNVRLEPFGLEAPATLLFPDSDGQMQTAVNPNRRRETLQKQPGIRLLKHFVA